MMIEVKIEINSVGSVGFWFNPPPTLWKFAYGYTAEYLKNELLLSLKQFVNQPNTKIVQAAMLTVVNGIIGGWIERGWIYAPDPLP